MSDGRRLIEYRFYHDVGEIWWSQPMVILQYGHAVKLWLYIQEFHGTGRPFHKTCKILDTIKGYFLNDLNQNRKIRNTCTAHQSLLMFCLPAMKVNNLLSNICIKWLHATPFRHYHPANLTTMNPILLSNHDWGYSQMIPRRTVSWVTNTTR